MKILSMPLGQKTIGAFFALATLFTACSKDDDKTEPVVIPNQEEVITTLIYTLTPEGGGDAVELIFRDLDGDGGAQPVITVDSLMAGTTYLGALELLNESEQPVEDITEEVKEEGDEHQFFFMGGSELTVMYNDKDVNNKPIGLNTKLTTTTAGEYALHIVLRHEPNKDASGVADGDITNAGGETDIEVHFDVPVK
jgi:hypothetical protein